MTPHVHLPDEVRTELSDELVGYICTECLEACPAPITFTDPAGKKHYLLYITDHPMWADTIWMRSAKGGDPMQVQSAKWA